MSVCNDYLYCAIMKKICIIAVCLISFSYAQVTKYVMASCVITSVDGKKDTIFNGNGGNINCTLDMTQKKILFYWDIKDYKTVKSYGVLEQKIVKDKMYETMGVYSMNLKCLNKEKKPCSIDFGINSRINNIDIVLVDGAFVLNFHAVETQ